MKTMNKLFLFILIAFVVSCSSDDDAANPVVNETYIDNTSTYKTISIVSDCDGPYQGSFCVTDETFNEVQQFITSSEESCPVITFNDVDGVERSGIYRSMGSNNGCTRQTNP